MTGLGMVTPLGNTVEDSWAALVAGESGAGQITQFDPDGFPVDFACEVKDLDVTDYVDYKASRRMDRFTHLALAAARQAEADSGPRHRRGGRARRRGGRDGDRRPQVVRGLHPGARRARPRPRQPVLDRPDHPEPRRRLGLDGARHEGPAALRVHGVRRVEHGDRRRPRRDPARPRRRDDLRRHRGAGLPRRDRRVRRDARDLAPQRRPEARVAAVRPRAGRVRDGRGGGDGRPRGARARAGARSEDLRRAARLRGLVRRDARLRPRPDRRTAPPARCGWPSTTPGSRPTRSAT